MRVAPETRGLHRFMAPNPYVLAEDLKDEARRLGFQLVGITTPDPPDHLEVYKNWVQAGRNGQMAYLATERALERRWDPRRILPECRSIVCLGIRYPDPREAEHTEEKPARGRVASYAWGEDYHLALPPRLKKLIAYLEGRLGQAIPHRFYTDTGPILERELAQRAGLGWIGKNTCLINPSLGSYFLLAEILLGIELPPDPPFRPDYCGSCTRCIQACPTDCILPDRTLDASRCLSYLTIELKGPIPESLRPALSDWVFGCDICQEVCPWNIRFASPAAETAFAPRPGVAAPALQEDLRLTPKAFNRKFKNNPVKRPKRRGYLRNVAVALGNSRDPAAAADLAASLYSDPEPQVRGHAAWALGILGGAEAYQALSQAAGTETSDFVVEEIRTALQKIQV